jgi:hypothetical protein
MGVVSSLGNQHHVLDTEHGASHVQIMRIVPTPYLLVEINEMVSVILVSSGSSPRLRCRWMTCLNLDEMRCVDVDPMPQISAHSCLFLFIRVQIDLLARCSIRAFERSVMPTITSMVLVGWQIENLLPKRK